MGLGRPLLEPRFLASMQTWVQGWDADSADILVRHNTTDEAGGTLANWAVLASYPCRLVPAWKLALEQPDKTEGKVVETNAWYVKLPFGVHVDPSYRIRVGTRVFEVTSSNEGRTFEIETIVQITELEDGDHP